MVDVCPFVLQLGDAVFEIVVVMIFRDLGLQGIELSFETEDCRNCGLEVGMQACIVIANALIIRLERSDRFT